MIDGLENLTHKSSQDKGHLEMTITNISMCKLCHTLYNIFRASNNTTYGQVIRWQQSLPCAWWLGPLTGWQPSCTGSRSAPEPPLSFRNVYSSAEIYIIHPCSAFILHNLAGGKQLTDVHLVGAHMAPDRLAAPFEMCSTGKYTRLSRAILVQCLKRQRKSLISGVNWFMLTQTQYQNKSWKMCFHGWCYIFESPWLK